MIADALQSFAALFSVKTFLLLFAVFVPLERLFAMHHEQRTFRAHWFNDMVYFFVNGLVVRFGNLALVSAFVLASTYTIPASFKTMVETAPLWLQVPILIAIADLIFYSVHRLFHTVPFLWRIHAVHHSIEELDWLAAHRVHPIDQILTKGSSLIPAFCLGFSVEAIAIHMVIYHWQSLLVHSNVKLPVGPLRWLVVSPEFHHWHHSNHREAYDKNFAGQLAFWDVLFGTAHMTNGQVPEKYGIDEPMPQNYLKQLVHPFAPPPTAQDENSAKAIEQPASAK